MWITWNLRWKLRWTVWFYNKVNTDQLFFCFFTQFKSLLRANNLDLVLLTAAATTYRCCHSETALQGVGRWRPWPFCFWRILLFTTLFPKQWLLWGKSCHPWLWPSISDPVQPDIQQSPPRKQPLQQRSASEQKDLREAAATPTARSERFQMLFPYFMLQPYAQIKISSPSLLLHNLCSISSCSVFKFKNLNWAGFFRNIEKICVWWSS